MQGPFVGLCGLMGWGKWSLERRLFPGLCGEVFGEIVYFFYRNDAKNAKSQRDVRFGMMKSLQFRIVIPNLFPQEIIGEVAALFGL